MHKKQLLARLKITQLCNFYEKFKQLSIFNNNFIWK